MSDNKEIKLKTLKDMYSEPNDLIRARSLRDAARNLIKAIQQASDKHWEELDKKGYCNDTYDPYNFKIGNLEFQCHHEATDDAGAVMILKYFFNLEEE